LTDFPPPAPATMPLALQELEPLLRAWSAGDLAARDELFPLVYPDLKRIASRHLDREVTGHTLDTTALVHEACLGLLGSDVPRWQGRAQFFAFMSTVMRHVLVDHARRRTADKRGGERVRVLLQDDLLGAAPAPDALLDLERAIEALAARSPRMARVAECRIFGGMTDAAIAEALDTSERTAAREWQRGKAWLRLALTEDDDARPPAPD
jgi:RNA polymerase sigma factor (TIGR02999 family)